MKALPFAKQSKKTTKNGKRVKTDRQKVEKELDDLVSKIVRLRDKKCIYCGTTNKLTCSHFWNRWRKSTRWSLENCDAACWPCHRYRLEQMKQGWYMDFKKKQLGEDEYLQLQYESEHPNKMTVNELKILLLSLKEELKIYEH